MHMHAPWRKTHRIIALENLKTIMNYAGNSPQNDDYELNAELNLSMAIKLNAVSPRYVQIFQFKLTIEIPFATIQNIAIRI